MKATVGELQRTKSGEEAPQLESMRKKKQKKRKKRHPDGLLVHLCGLSNDKNDVMSGL